ncbi:hypothetical protein FVE85_2862 [Porphyridium purpureum]|uniref:Retrotransposon gag domain-containing protein n=1 Tax=Porphyridium purpureum TaxID=35688 RepID=A0A5J4YSZ2_PORPP|nr:hypothetical protein FVE85_2862 [Porphyridium purpureum]|eukprot:POR2901..scf227_4
MENLRQALVPRMAQEPGVQVSRLDTYNGSRDVIKLQTWLFAAGDTVFVPLRDAVGVTATRDTAVRAAAEAKAVRVAATYLRGSALVWWIALSRAGDDPAVWDTFVRELEDQFTPPNAARAAYNDLAALVQKHSVARYIDEFQMCILRIPRITEDEKLDRFVRGLKKPPRVEVLKSGATTVADAMRIALSVDSAYADAPRGACARDDGPVPMELGAVGFSTAQGGGTDNARKVKCWRCGKAGHRKADSVDAGRRITALFSSPCSVMVTLDGSVEARALADSGANACFVRRDVADAMHAARAGEESACSDPGFSIQLADESKTHATGMLRAHVEVGEVPLFGIARTLLTAHFLGLEKLSYDVVLGKPWLEAGLPKPVAEGEEQAAESLALDGAQAASTHELMHTPRDLSCEACVTGVARVLRK